ncbi:glycoside hydrolase family 43 protein [Thermodesulfobacteriota bacterium]
MIKSKMLLVLSSFLMLGGGLTACGVDEEDPLNTTLPSEPQYGKIIDLPGAGGWPADPSVIEVEGAWYLYPTTTSVSIECWRSDDFENWSYEGVVWGPAVPGAWNDNNVWAPDVFEHEGQFYLYYSANEMIGVAVADSPMGPFVDAYDHPLIGGGYGGVAFNTIDPHMFRDRDARLYLYATGYSPLTFMRVIPMSDPLTVGGDWSFLFMANPFSWEGFISEGPWMVVRDNVYYLMYSGNGANRPQYALGYATADNPTGPFTKNERNPILEADSDYDFYGPGHNSVTVGPGGELWMFYHTKVNACINWERLLRKNKIAFGEDGQLYVDLGVDPSPPL